MPQPGDDKLLVLFKHEAIENRGKSLLEGRPIFDDIEVCEIRIPGNKDVKPFPATVRSHWETNPYTGETTEVTYAERFAHQYRQFKEKTAQTKSGTPLDVAPFLTAGKRAELRAQNVYIVEQLAAIDGQELKNLGPGGRDLKNQAVEYLAESRAGASSLQMAAELEASRARIAMLEEDARLKALRHPEAPPAKIDFDDMTVEQIREYITTHTGIPPTGSLSHKTLKTLAADIKPSKAA